MYCIIILKTWKTYCNALTASILSIHRVIIILKLLNGPVIAVWWMLGCRLLLPFITLAEVYLVRSIAAVSLITMSCTVPIARKEACTHSLLVELKQFFLNIVQ